ncbi:MAG: diguanylate cyclase, partial [Candidatus Limnocylindrales bacterium]
YHNCRVYQLEREDELVPIAFAGRVGAYEKVEWDALRTRVGQGFTGWVAEHRVPLLVPDASADPRGMNIPGTDDVDESMVVAPMCYEDRLIGVITLSKLGLHQFDDTHVRLLTILADQAATAVESARLLDRSTGLGQELGRLHAMGSELAQTLDPRQVADLIARHLAGALGVERCAISYWDQAADDLLTWGYHPVARRENVEPVYHLAHFPETRRVLREQAAVTVDVTDPAADPAEAAVLRAGGDAAALMLPLVAKGESIGLVELVSIRPITIDGARLEFIRTMANEAAMALENARLYESARTLADRDQLTGFYNHRYLHERLGEEIVRAQRSRRSLALLMVDLDDFKLVNDTFGHLFGDRVLAWTADVIRSALRASDVATRYGGDEFAILLPETNEAEAAVVADRVVEALLGRPYEVEGRRPLPIGASIGAAVFPADGRTAQDLIARADAALYRVKRAAIASASSGTGASRARAQPPRTRRRVAGPQVGREAEGAR